MMRARRWFLLSARRRRSFPERPPGLVRWVVGAVTLALLTSGIVVAQPAADPALAGVWSLSLTTSATSINNGELATLTVSLSGDPYPSNMRIAIYRDNVITIGGGLCCQGTFSLTDSPGYQQTSTYTAYLSATSPEPGPPPSPAAVSNSVSVTNTGWHGKVMLVASKQEVAPGEAYTLHVYPATTGGSIPPGSKMTVYDDLNVSQGGTGGDGVMDFLLPMTGGLTARTFTTYLSLAQPTTSPPSIGVIGVSAPVTVGWFGGPLPNGLADGNRASTVHPCPAGDPVTCSSGEFWHTFTDVSVPARGGTLGVTRTFNSKLATTDGPFGFGWSCTFCGRLTFSSSGPFASVETANGSTISFSGSFNSGYRPAGGQFASLTSTAAGYVVTVRGRESFTYDTQLNSNRLISSSDLVGNTITYGYAGGNLTSITDAGGRTVSIAYAGSHVSSVTDPLGRVTSYAYDGAGNMATSTDPTSRVTSYTYDSNHLMLTMTNPAHGVVTNTYDASARVLTQTDPAGRVTTFSYGSRNPFLLTDGTTTITEPSGNVKVETFIRGALAELTQGFGTPDARTWKYGLDPATLSTTAVMDPNGKTSSQTYDAAGNVASTTDADGRKTSFTYDSLNDMLTRTDSANMTTSMVYTQTGLLQWMKTPYGTGTALTYFTYGDAAHPGDLTSVADPNNHTTNFTYDAYGDVNSVKDADGNVTTATFDADGDGEKITAVAANGNVTGCGCAAANTATFTYYGNGQVKTLTDAKGGVTSFTYDANANPATVQDPTLLTTSSTYDADNMVKTVTRPDGSVTTFGYDANSRRISVQNGTQPAATVTYDALDHVLTATDPVGKVTTNTYDAGGRLTSTLSANGGTTSYTYFDAGQLKTVTSPTGGVTTYAYDSAARVASVTDPLTNVTGYAYDALGRPTVTTRADATTTVNAYDAAGQLTSFTDGAGKVTSYAYSAGGRLSSSTDPNLRVTTYGYDASGNAKTVTDALSRVTTNSFDTLNRLTGIAYSATGTAAVSYTYDAAGRRTAMTDGTGTTTTAYDAYGRLKSVTAPAGVTGYTYDTLGRIATVTYPDGHAVTRGYDNADRFSTLTDWNNKVTTFGYDNDSNLASTAFPNGVTDTTTRNTADQTTGITVAKGPSTLASFGYTPDLAGQLKTGTDSLAPAALSTTFGYSKLNQLGTVASATANYTYDNSGNLTGLTNGSTLTYDNAGQLKVLTPTAGQPTTFAFNGVGDRTSASTPGTGTVPGTTSTDVNVAADITTGAGTVTTPAFSTSTASERLLALVAAGPGTGTQAVNVSGAGLTWTRVNQANTQAGDAEIWTATATSKLTAQTVTAVQTSAGGKLSLQVLSFTGSSGIGASSIASGATGAARVALTTTGANSRTFAVGFNGPGNATTTVASGQTLLHALTTTGTAGNGWMQKTTNATTTTGTVVTLADTAPTALAWNMAAVELLAAPVPAPTSTVTYGYDQTSQLTSYAKTGSPTSTYTYNGDGLRAASVTSGVTTRYAWDTMAGLPLLLADGTNDYLYGPTGEVVAQINKSTGVTTYLHTDRIGSVRVATDATVRTASFDPYGKLITQTGTAATPFGFSGEYTDPTGLVYLRARYYDPTTGAFLTIDPLVDLTKDPYAYTAGNPLNGTDPAGLMSCPLCRSAWNAVTSVASPGSTLANNLINTYNYQRNTGSSVLGSIGNSAVINLDPAYMVVEGYGNEWRDAKNGCSGWTIFKDGAEGVLGVAATGATAIGGAGLLRGSLGRAAENGGGFLSGLRARMPRGDAGAIRFGRAPEYKAGQLTQGQAMDVAEQWLGAGYKEVSPGRYLSSDGARVVRYGAHETRSAVEHIHFEAYENGFIVENTVAEIIP